MENSYGDSNERKRSICLRIVAMTACAAAFAAGILLPPATDEIAVRSTPEYTRVATAAATLSE